MLGRREISYSAKAMTAKATYVPMMPKEEMVTTLRKKRFFFTLRPA